jgi:A nuclease of the HNH/ENDO VII superfamily with conserved LHH
MVDYRTWATLLGEILREFRHLVQAEVERFTYELENWVNGLIMEPLPADWRKRTAAFLLHWEQEGYQLSPQSVATLDRWIEAWAAKRGFLPKQSKANTASAAANEEPAAAELQSEATSKDPLKSRTISPAPKVPKNWPVLTETEEERAQKSTGLPWWYPIQPRNRFDSLWQRQFVNYGQAARDRLLDFYREAATLGRAGRSIEPSEGFDPTPLLHQRDKVQKAYDRYLQAKADVYREWTRYLTMDWLIGPEVLKVFQKVDNALPNRVEGFESPQDAPLRAARRASIEATDKKQRRLHGTYTALYWTDWVITGIEIATLLGSARAAMRKTFEKALARGLSETAARNVMIAYGVAHLATAAASAAVMAEVVPPILAAAGLDEAEVRAGLALFRAVFTIVGLRSITKGKPKSGQSTPQRRPDVPRPAPIGIRPPQFWKKTITYKGLKVHQRSDLIDPKRLDSKGRTSLELMRSGKPPIGPDGDPLHLHHMLQTADGGVAEVTAAFHLQNRRAIHLNPTDTPSGINRAEFNKWRKGYWMQRARDFERK